MKTYKYIYGPVSSWRLGKSLGVDPLSGKIKICTFDCIYCQLGKTKAFVRKRKIFVPTEKIIDEIKSLPKLKIDYITFSGMGEPTLAKNLGEIIRQIKKIRKVRQGRPPAKTSENRWRAGIRLWRKKIAVLTNSSLMHRKDVQKDLLLADFVAAKLDAHSQDLFAEINKPQKKIKFNALLKAIKQFKSKFHGKFVLQIMFVETNRKFAKEIAQLAKEIRPDEVHINTPLRPCGVKPLSKDKLNAIKKYFKGLRCVCVYDVRRKKTRPLSRKDTLRRRGEL